jgi:hypothetical protein
LEARGSASFEVRGLRLACLRQVGGKAEKARSQETGRQGADGIGEEKWTESIAVGREEFAQGIS